MLTACPGLELGLNGTHLFKFTVLVCRLACLAGGETALERVDGACFVDAGVHHLVLFGAVQFISRGRGMQQLEKVLLPLPVASLGFGFLN